MSVTATATAGLRRCAATLSASELVRSAAKVPLARTSSIIVRFANVPRTTSAHPTPNVDQNATATLTVPAHDQLATMEFARIPAMALAVLTPTATCVD